MDSLDEVEDLSAAINVSCNSIKGLMGTKLIRFTKGNFIVLKGACVDIGTSYNSYNAMDIQTGELYVIKEVPIATSEKNSCEQYISKLTDLKHNNLFELKSFQFESIDEENWFLYILQKFDFGFLSMSLLSEKNISITNDMLKNITKNILSVIRYVTLKEIDNISVLASSVFIDNQGNVKLCHFGFDTFLNSADLSNQEKRNTLNLLADMLAALHGGDIVLTFSEQFQEFLNKCRSATSCDLSGVEELLNHSFIQEPCSANNCNQLQDKSFEDDNSRFALERKCSRIESDFEIECQLGKGNFGKIYKVKDKVDEKYYALKVINLSTNHKENEKTIKEAKFLADLQHENIVRYYNSWTDNVLDENIHNYYHSSPNMNDDDDDVDDSCLSDSIFHQSSLSSNSVAFIIDASVDDLDDNEQLTAVAEVDGRDCNDFSVLPSHPDRALYIKMEFCESNTLESAIGNDLYLDENRIWRFLKEIVEGLHYIHNKNIIHRDLKPANIFLDSNDHVKIGDFGLATTNQLYPSQDIEPNSSQNGSYEVVYGTYYYRAPESSSSHTIIRDPKLDMYSLGVILFEMCYPQLFGHERNVVLTNLRSSNIIFPSDFLYSTRQRQELLIRKLLNHDPEKRPNCHELRNSNCIPSLEEDKRQMLMIRTLIDNPQSRMNQYLFEYLFTTTNNMNNTKRLSYVNIHQTENITRILFDIFKRYGGKNLDLCQSSVQNTCTSKCGRCIKLVDNQGSLIVIPCNNRKVLAKFVTLGRNTTWLRCYSTHKSFKFKSYSCNFDIITPIDLRKDQNYLPEAEILLILDEMRNSCVHLVPFNFTLYVNHTSILEAIFEECGILSHSSYISFVSTFVPKGTHRKALLSFYMSSKAYEKYSKILEVSYDLMDNSLNSLFLNFFRKPDLYQKVRKAIDELRSIYQIAGRLGLTVNLIFNPKCLLSCWEENTGMVAVLHYKIPNQRDGVEIAVAGRYDDYLNSVHSKMPMIRTKRFGVGITVLLDNFKRVLDLSKLAASEEVTVCYFSKTVPAQAVEVFKRLHSAKIPCSFIKMQSEKHQKEFCKKNDIACYILLKNDLKIRNKILIHHQNVNRVIDINDVVPAVEIVLYCKSNFKLVVTKPIYFEAPIFFLTVPRLTTDEEFKCKIKILHNKDKIQDSIIFVVNSRKDLIMSFIDCCEMGEVTKSWCISLEFPFNKVFELLFQYNREQVILFNISDTDTIHIKDTFTFKRNTMLKKPASISDVSPFTAISPKRLS